MHADIRAFCTKLFNLAARALETFQDYKKQRGLIDFTDQEHLLYTTLEHPQVQAVLADELELLLVDEFQDTSPLQLALFLRLAKFAKQVIWVGDVKQAIYGFRGSDPELMQAILQHLIQHGGKTEILPTSWRSRPELVNYVNAIFVPAFANSLEAERVALQPRPGVALQTANALEYWQLTDRNTKKRYSALAQGLKQFIANGYPVLDKATKLLRNADYGDIALLSRLNANLATAAEIFSDAGIPVSRNQTGLLQTPEAALVLAAIRYLAVHDDALAIAELITLTQGLTPESWLEDRLHYLATPSPSGYWGDSIPLLRALAAERSRLRYLTPVEVMHLALDTADIRRLVLQWQVDPRVARQRLLNIEQLIKLANDYEKQCAHAGQLATLTGMLLWLTELAKQKEDFQAVDTQATAVQLLTHHGAKGLEWPIVIVLDLDSDIRDNYWGLKVTTSAQELDITQPLQGRSLCYWLWPFGKQKSQISVNDQMARSEYGVKAQQQALEEAKRLLYVSFTRPRDCLIFALKEPKGGWIDSLEATWMLPDQADAILLRLPDGTTIPACYKTLTAREELQTDRPASSEPLRWLAGIGQSQAMLAANVSPSKLQPGKSAYILEEIQLGERIALQGSPDMALLGTALHAMIAVQLINQPTHPEVLAEQVLSRYAVNQHISVQDAVKCVQRLQDFIARSFNVQALYVEYPFTYQLPTGQQASGWIDLLIKTEAGYIIIDHKSNPQTSQAWHELALQYSGQLQLYKTAVESLTCKPVLSCWIHFAVTGGILQVGLDR